MGETHCGEAPFARGTVTNLVPLGDTTLAEIDWKDADMPKRVNVANSPKLAEKASRWADY